MSRCDDELVNTIDGFLSLFDIPLRVVNIGRTDVKNTENTAAKETTKKAAEPTKEGSACCRTEKREPTLIDFIDSVICQDSAVVVFWKDGTKTIAKCGPDDTFDYEKGLAIAVLKYVFGNKVYQVDMKNIIETYPHTKTTVKKTATSVKETVSKASKKTTTKTATVKKTTTKSNTTKKSAAKKTSTKSTTTKKNVNKKTSK